MQGVLAQFGAGMSNIVDETLFVTDMDELMDNVVDVYGAREKAYGGSHRGEPNGRPGDRTGLPGTENRNKMYCEHLKWTQKYVNRLQVVTR